MFTSQPRQQQRCQKARRIKPLTTIVPGTTETGASESCSPPSPYHFPVKSKQSKRYPSRQSFLVATTDLNFEPSSDADIVEEIGVGESEWRRRHQEGRPGSLAMAKERSSSPPSLAASTSSPRILRRSESSRTATSGHSDQRQNLTADFSVFDLVAASVLCQNQTIPLLSSDSCTSTEPSSSSSSPSALSSSSKSFSSAVVSSDMQQPPSSSPPPYSPVELGPDTTQCYFNPLDPQLLQPQQLYARHPPSFAAASSSSSNTRSYPCLASSQPNLHSTGFSSNSQPRLYTQKIHSHIPVPGHVQHTNCQVRRRPNAALGSGSSSRLLSPTNSDSDDGEHDEGAIYARTSSGVRRSHSDPYLTNGGVSTQEGNALSTSIGNGYNNNVSKNKAKGRRWKWSWRHWLFAIAAGVVGVGDGEWDDRDKGREEKVICTTPGGICAGETETETDEPSRHLPTARIPPSTPHPFILTLTHFFPEPIQRFVHLHHQRLLPLLFEFCRLLSIVPAVLGTMWNLYSMVWPPGSAGGDGDVGGGWGRRSPPERLDFFVAALWSILTGYQCLCLTTGLFTRWLAYYPPLATLIRLLALQGICWPATQVTLSVLEVGKRPGICWAVVGSTTCASRAIVIWVTSNLVEVVGDEGEGGQEKEKEGREVAVKANGPSTEGQEDRDLHHRCYAAVPPPGFPSMNSHPPCTSPSSASVSIAPCTCPSSTLVHSDTTSLTMPSYPPTATTTATANSLPILNTSHAHAHAHQGPRSRRKFKWNSSRRWDWKEVGIKCVLPAGMVYFVMAWLGEMRREWGC